MCAAEVTALRLARKQYVQGSDGPVRTMELVKIDGKWYAPSAALTVVEPTREDIAAQVAIDAKREAVAKAKAAGLTPQTKPRASAANARVQLRRVMEEQVIGMNP